MRRLVIAATLVAAWIGVAHAQGLDQEFMQFQSWQAQQAQQQQLQEMNRRLQEMQEQQRRMQFYCGPVDRAYRRC